MGAAVPARAKTERAAPPVLCTFVARIGQIVEPLTVDLRDRQTQRGEAPNGRACPTIPARRRQSPRPEPPGRWRFGWWPAHPELAHESTVGAPANRSASAQTSNQPVVISWTGRHSLYST